MGRLPVLTGGETMSDYFRKTARFAGKKYEATGKTELEALQKLAKKLEAAKAGAVCSTMTCDAWYEKWRQTYKDSADLTAKSLQTYDQKYYGHISPRIGHMKLVNVTDVHLQRIMNDQKGTSFSHASKVRMVMQAMFKQARKSRLIPYDPAEDIKLPAVTKGSHRSLTAQERSILLEVAKTHPAGLMILTMLYTGMRNSELAALTWADVDFKRNEIHIHSAMESGAKAIKAPKTDAGFRDIPIQAPLLPLLLEAVGEPFSPVFPNAKGGHMDEDTVQRRWRSFKKAMDLHMGAVVKRNKIIEHKVADDLTMYCLRHTFATDCERAEIPINVAKELLGHSDIAVTANIYTHKDTKVLHQNIAKLEQAGGKAGGNQSEEKDIPTGT